MRRAKRLMSCLLCVGLLIAALPARSAPLGAQVVLSGVSLEDIVENDSAELSVTLTYDEAKIDYVWNTTTHQWELGASSKTYSTLEFVNNSADCAVDVDISCGAPAGEAVDQGLITGAYLSGQADAGNGSNKMSIGTLGANDGTWTAYLHYICSAPTGPVSFTAATTLTINLSTP